MPYSIFIVNSLPGCSLPDDCSGNSDSLTTLKASTPLVAWLEGTRGKAALCLQMAEVAQGDMGNLICWYTPRSGYSVQNHYTHAQWKRKEKKKKTPVSTRNRKQWYEKENKNLWTHKATKEAGIFLFTVSIFYTHIYLYKGFMPFPVCPYEWQAECWCCCFLSALLLFNAELALYWQGRLLKNIPQAKAPHCQIRAWHRNVQANTSQGTNTTFTFCTDTSRLPLQSCTIMHCKKKMGTSRGSPGAVVSIDHFLAMYFHFHVTCHLAVATGPCYCWIKALPWHEWRNSAYSERSYLHNWLRLKRTEDVDTERK